MALHLLSSPATPPAVVVSAAQNVICRARIFHQQHKKTSLRPAIPLGQVRIIRGAPRFYCMQVVNPFTNKRYETLSYVPALDDQQIVKQVDYIVSKGWIPCLEFDQEASLSRDNSKICGYYDGRYWTLWKLPMFGCKDGSMILREIEECKQSHPNAFIRLMAFDNRRQAQVMAIVVHKPHL